MLPPFLGLPGAVMVTLRPDSEPSMAAASRLVSQVTSIVFEMLLPVGAGYWLDGYFKTEPWCVSVGAILGLFVSMTSLVQLAQRANQQNQPKKSTPSESSSSVSDKSGDPQ